MPSYLNGIAFLALCLVKNSLQTSDPSVIPPDNGNNNNNNNNNNNHKIIPPGNVGPPGGGYYEPKPQLGDNWFYNLNVHKMNQENEDGEKLPYKFYHHNPNNPAQGYVGLGQQNKQPVPVPQPQESSDESTKGSDESTKTASDESTQEESGDGEYDTKWAVDPNKSSPESTEEDEDLNTKK